MKRTLAVLLLALLLLVVALAGAGNARRGSPTCVGYHDVSHIAWHTGGHFGPVEGEREPRWHDESHIAWHTGRHLGPASC